MKTTAASSSDKGPRFANEDRVLADSEIGIYGVFDGVGGHTAGEVAAELACRTVLDYFTARLDAERKTAKPSALSARAAVQEAIVRASHAIYQRASQDPDCKGMGTTASIVYVSGSKATIGHVGDSRVYLLRNKSLDQLTRDHTVGQELFEKGVGTLEDLLQGPYANVLSRAVGPQPTVEVDCVQVDLIPGDRLFLCSDGLWSVLPSIPDTVAILQSPLEDGAPLIVAKALQADTSDNSSVVLVECINPDAVISNEEQERIEFVTLTREVLKSVQLFRDLTTDELARTVERFTMCTYSRGHALMNEGEPGDSMYVVLDGFFQVVQDGVALAAIGKGSHVGEIALLLGGARSATVHCLAQSKLLRLSRTDFEALTEESPKIGVKILRALAEELAARIKATNQIAGRTA